MTLRSMVLAGLCVFGLAVSSAPLHMTSASAEPSVDSSSSSSTSSLPCFVDRTETTTPKAPASADSIRVQVSVDVASTTRLQLGKDGAVEAVATNTGCAPKITDDFIVENSRNDEYATPALVAAALLCKTGSDWEDTSRWHRCQ